MCLSGVASGLLTYAIVKLDGRGGHTGWSWVFQIEGLVTIVFGIISFFLMPSSIKRMKLLTNEEKTILIERLERNVMTSLASSAILDENHPAKSTSQQVWEAFKSPRVVMLSIAQFASANNIASLAYFTPTIIHSVIFHSEKSRPAISDLLHVQISKSLVTHQQPLSFILYHP